VVLCPVLLGSDARTSPGLVGRRACRGGRGVLFVGFCIGGCACICLPNFQPTSLLSSRDPIRHCGSLRVQAGTKLWVHNRPIAYALLRRLAIHIILSLFRQLQHFSMMTWLNLAVRSVNRTVVDAFPGLQFMTILSLFHANNRRPLVCSDASESTETARAPVRSASQVSQSPQDIC
jgi:hypothetical protein